LNFVQTENGETSITTALHLPMGNASLDKHITHYHKVQALIKRYRLQFALDTKTTK